MDYKYCFLYFCLLYVDKNGGIFNQLDNFMSNGYTFEVRARSTYNSNDYDIYFVTLVTRKNRSKNKPRDDATCPVIGWCKL